MIQGFEPIIGDVPCVLILGTIPSVASLDAGEYYAHSRNSFWGIIEESLGSPPGMTYEQRTSLLIRERIALWDVLRAAQREGSLDTSIARHSEVPNDVAGLLAAHPTIRTVILNGAKAEELFRRHVELAIPVGRELRVVRLPSTSPANASVDRATKGRIWSSAIRAALSRPSLEGPQCGESR